MKKSVKVKIAKVAKSKMKFKACNTITCIHNIDSKCMLNNCELYERSLRQEY